MEVNKACPLASLRVRFAPQNCPIGYAICNGIINGDIADSYDIYQEIRDAITALRHDNHMTQKDLASRTGLTQANISNLEKGSSKPTIETLK